MHSAPASSQDSAESSLKPSSIPSSANCPLTLLWTPLWPESAAEIFELRLEPAMDEATDCLLLFRLLRDRDTGTCSSL